MNKSVKNITIWSIIIMSVTGFCLFAYLWFAPHLVSSVKVHNFVQKFAKEKLGITFLIEKPVLNTSLTPYISFKVDKINLSKGSEQIFNLDKLNAEISFSEIFTKTIKINRLSVESFFIDVNKLLGLMPKQQEKKKPKHKPSSFNVDVFDALMYARDVKIFYVIDENTSLKIISKGFGTNNARKENRRVYFNFLFDIVRNNQQMKISVKDQAKVIIDDKTLFISDLPVNINGSNLYIRAIANRRIKYNVDIYSNNFKLENVIKLIDSNLLIPNGQELLAMTANNIKGDFSFNIKFNKKKLNGLIKLKNATANIAFLNNLPVRLTQGEVTFDEKDITLKDFAGYYINSPEHNKVKFFGKIKDYMKTMQFDIQADAFLTNAFTQNYLSPLVGCKINLVGDVGTRAFIKSKNNKFDILAYSRLMPKENILVDGMSLTPIDYERIVKFDFHFEDMLLKIKDIEYFIGVLSDANSFKRHSIMKMSGNVDCVTGKILDLGINIPKPLPSEFFNIFAGEKFFKKGKVQGKIHVDNTGKYPVLNSNMNASGIKVPSLRLKINDANILTTNNNIHLNAKGKFKRSDYNLTGDINNNLTLPVVIKDINLTVDDIDAEKILNTFNKQNTSEVTVIEHKEDVKKVEDSDDAFVFDTGLLVIDSCRLNLIKGVYKDVVIENLNALLTLNRQGVLQISSNKFNIAEGLSSLKLYCDLINHKYNIKLGCKGVNSDIMASSILGLGNEISGKANGFINLETDETLKLNGIMKFSINNGTIGKVGLLEYLLNFVAIFRNPLTMISPSTLVDMVNIPNGNFDKINGELNIKNNVIEKMMIQSKAPLLSAFIIGRYDLGTRDALIRIYTKTSNSNAGICGFLRKFSLNAISNKIPLGNNNEANYYSEEIKLIPKLEDGAEEDSQIFLTKVDGDVERNNFISSLKRIK